MHSSKCTNCLLLRDKGHQLHYKKLVNMCHNVIISFILVIPLIMHLNWSSARLIVVIASAPTAILSEDAHM